MIIVSDSGPLAYLVEIGVADSLPTLYGQVYVPPTFQLPTKSIAEFDAEVNVGQSG